MGVREALAVLLFSITTVAYFVLVAYLTVRHHFDSREPWYALVASILGAAGLALFTGVCVGWIAYIVVCALDWTVEALQVLGVI